MRPIKFRAWDKSKNKMWSAEELGSDELTINPDGRGFVNVNSTLKQLSEYYLHLIPLQFTGLCDKNGDEIFEGDIVKINNGRILDDIETVVWGGHWNYAGFGLAGTGSAADHAHSWDSLNPETVKVCKVLGNLYENPELLKP